MKKLIEHFSDFPMTTEHNDISKHSYIRYKMGRLKHELWLANRKSTDTILVDQYDNFIINNLKTGKTCLFGSAGYYLDEVIDDLTVIEQWNIVKEFYPKAIIVEHRSEIAENFPETFDNFVVINNRSDHWRTLDPVTGMGEHIGHYVKAMNDGAVFFYSFRDTQILGINRLTEDQGACFYKFAKDIEKTYNLNLLWHNIEFATKEEYIDGGYSILENPDTTNGNIKLVFQLNDNSHKLDMSYYSA